MDFLSNLIKRPNSIALSEPEPKPSSSAVPAPASQSQSASPSPSQSLITLAMDRCSIDADSLDNLFDSTAQDLDCLEQQHKQLIENLPEPAANPAPGSMETFQQMLNEINFSLDEVTAREMEHLQAMSLELSPLAVKPSGQRHSLEQQKALVTAMRSTSQPATPTAPTPNRDAEPALLKFAGLPEFDETQIPELAPLSAEMEAQLKESACAPTVKLSDHDYNSDSDIYAECLSLNSGKFSADQSELEAYSSALTEVLEQQLSNATATTLENTLSEPDTAHDNSCEPMDVDDINETMELLKDVLAPEDHQLLQQQFLGGAMQQQQLKEDQLKQAPDEEKEVPQKFCASSVCTLEEQLKLVGQQDQGETCLKQKQSNQQEQSVKQEEFIQQELEKSPQMEKSVQQEQLLKEEPTLNQEQFLEKKQSPQLEKSLQQELSMQQEHFMQSERHQEPILQQKQSPQQEQSMQQEQLLQLEQSLHQEQIMQQQEQSPQQEKFMQQEQSLHQEQIMQQQQSPQLVKSVQQEQLLKEEQCLNDEQLMPQQEQILEQKQLPQQAQTPPKEQPPLLEQEVIPQVAAAPFSPPLPTAQLQTKYVEQPAPAVTASIVEIPQAAAEPQLVSQAEKPTLEQCTQQTEPTQESPSLELRPMSPPIPTHRTKTLDELQEFQALQAYEQPAEVKQAPNVQGIPVATVLPITKQAMPLPTLDLSSSNCTSPTSPTFPLRSPEESPNHFPHSPHAPVEQEEMPYLEQAIIEPAAEFRSCLSGVIARSPLPVELTLTHPSPEQEQKLNTTGPINGGSPLNGTFNHASPELSDATTSRGTFGVPLAAVSEQQRRTFSVTQEEEQQLNATYGMPLQQRRTFSLEDAPKQPSQMRRTFCLEQAASPAMEATEESVVGDDLDSEPMEVDTSVRMETTVVCPPVSPPLPAQQAKQLEQLKRQAIHGDGLQEQMLSVKEQLSASDEKEDVFVEHFGAMSPITEDIFKQPPCISSLARTKKSLPTPSMPVPEQFCDAEFQDGASNNNIILNSSDFDYLYTKGSNNAPIDRSSLLLKFDPLLGAPVPVNQSHQQQQEQALLNILSSNNNNLTRALSPTLEEHETSGSNQSFVIEPSAKAGGGAAASIAAALAAAQKDYKPPVDRTKKHAKMSVDVIDNDCNKTFDNSNLNSEDKTHKYHNMDELEKKIKNEVTRSEDIEKKLKEAEQREEALVKRITEKDKTNTKLNGVIEAYEKAIAELIHDKEQLVQNHERQMQEIQTDRDSNYHHLTSLETTFSDLHVKYEKSKEMTSHLKQIEDNLLEEKKKLMDKLRQQEQRYEQMKSHAMQQMEIANKKLATQTKEHTDEVKKLKALLKKEEVSRISTAEQLQQKSRENADLLKICEELIYDKGQGGSS